MTPPAPGSPSRPPRCARSRADPRRDPSPPWRGTIASPLARGKGLHARGRLRDELESLPGSSEPTTSSSPRALAPPNGAYRDAAVLPEVVGHRGVISLLQIGLRPDLARPDRGSVPVSRPGSIRLRQEVWLPGWRRGRPPENGRNWRGPRRRETARGGRMFGGTAWAVSS